MRVRIVVLGPLLSGLWAGLIVSAPPGLKLLPFNLYAETVHGLSLGLIPSRSLYCETSIDGDTWVGQELAGLIPIHMTLVSAYLLLFQAVWDYRWPGLVQTGSRWLSGLLLLGWALVVGTGISPGGIWDIPCLVLAWTSLLAGPFVGLITLSGWWRGRWARRDRVGLPSGAPTGGGD